MNKSAGIIPLAFLLALFGIKEAQARETFTVRNNSHNASFLFKVYSDVNLSTGHGFSLQTGGRTPVTNYMKGPLAAGDTMLFLIELPDGQYEVKPIGLGNTSDFEVSLNPEVVDVGDNIKIYDGTSVYHGGAIRMFLDNMDRREVIFRFPCPREIALSAREIAFKTVNGIERYAVVEEEKTIFRLMWL